MKRLLCVLGLAAVLGGCGEFGTLTERAEQGDAQAQYELGKLRWDGTNDDLAKDRAEAIRLFRKAAEQGHADAQYSLGESLTWGEGITRYPSGFQWYRKAAEQGDAEAQKALKELGVE